MISIPQNQLFRASEPVQINGGGESYTIKTLRGAVVATVNGKLSPGHYFVETASDKSQFLVLPDDYRGSHLSGLEASEAAGPSTDQAGRMKVSFARSLTCYWSEMQPSKTSLNWSEADAVVAVNTAAGLKICFTAWLTPSWVTEATAVTEYVAFLKLFTQRYKGKLHSIEIWNEANRSHVGNQRVISANPNYSTARACYELCKLAYPAIKAIDPNVLVVGFGWSPTGERMEDVQEFVNLGGAQYLDAFNLHDYHRHRVDDDQPNIPYLGTSMTILSILEGLRRLRAIWPKAILMNEGGLYGTSAIGLSNGDNTQIIESKKTGIGWQRGMARAIKYAVLYQVGGVDMIVPHVLAGYSSKLAENYEFFGYEFGARGPHPKTGAFLMTGHWLRDATCTARQDTGDIRGYEFLRAGEKVTVLFAPEGSTADFFPPASWKVTDTFGVPWASTSVGEEAVFIHGQSLSASLSAVIDPRPIAPDLQVEKINYATKMARSFIHSVKVTVRNNGSAAPPCALTLYVTPNISGFNEAGRIAQVHVPPIPARSSVVVDVPVSVEHLAVGSFWYWAASVDVYGKIAEPNEVDNAFLQKTTPSTEITQFVSVKLKPAQPNPSYQFRVGVAGYVWAQSEPTGAGPLAYSYTPMPPGSNMELASGVLRGLKWTPASSHIGTHRINVRVTDGISSDTVTIAIEVKP